MESDYSTWQIDSLNNIAGVAFKEQMKRLYNICQLDGGTLVDSNTVYFYYADGNSVTSIETCNTLQFMLVYLKDDKAPVYSGTRAHLDRKFKWFRIASQWYFLAIGRT